MQCARGVAGETVPDWFTGGDMLAAGGFCSRMLGWPTGELLVSRKDSPASARAPDRLLTIKNRFDHPCSLPPVRKPQARARGIRVASRRCRIGSPADAQRPGGSRSTKPVQTTDVIALCGGRLPLCP